MSGERDRRPERGLSPPHRYGIPALAAAALLFCRIEPVHACGALPCAQVNEIQPPDGSVGVPRNTQLRVLYFGALESYDEAGQPVAVDVSPMRIVPSAGEPIPLTGSVSERPEAFQAWVVAQPAQLLAADTTYEVQLLGGRDACSVDASEWTTVSSFTTGAGEDHDAPSFAGLDELTYGERLTSSSDCGNSDGIAVFLQFRAATDASPATRYDIYVDGHMAQRYAELRASRLLRDARIFVDCGTMSLASGPLVAPGSVLALRAVDLAGNQSTNGQPLTIEASCESASSELPTPELGPRIAPPDEEIPADDEAPSTRGDGSAGASADTIDSDTSAADTSPAGAAPAGRASMGCTLAHERAGAPALVLGALLLALLGRRARPARRA